MAHRNLSLLQLEEATHRKEQLKKCAAEKAAELNTMEAMAIKQLKCTEIQQCTFRKNCAAMGKSKKGLSVLDIPDHEQGCKLVSEADQIHSHLLLNRNEMHFEQAIMIPHSEHRAQDLSSSTQKK